MNFENGDVTPGIRQSRVYVSHADGTFSVGGTLTSPTMAVAGTMTAIPSQPSEGLTMIPSGYPAYALPGNQQYDKGFSPYFSEKSSGGEATRFYSQENSKPGDYYYNNNPQPPQQQYGCYNDFQYGQYQGYCGTSSQCLGHPHLTHTTSGGAVMYHQTTFQPQQQQPYSQSNFRMNVPQPSFHPNYQQHSNFNSQQQQFPVRNFRLGTPTICPQQPNSQRMPTPPQSLASSVILKDNPSPLPVFQKDVDKTEEVRETAEKQFVKEKAVVPYGWRRLILSDSVLYFSPSGIQLKSLQEVKDYLSTEGTCKCGLECAVVIDKMFDFDCKKQSEVWSQSTFAESMTNSKCNHRKSILAHLNSKVQHLHSPVSEEKKGKKKKKKKNKTPYSGMTMSEMIQAREAEKLRINEIINQQKREYEAQMNTKETTPSVDDPVKPNKTKSSWSENKQRNDEAKNIEIRRMSSTNEGDKILQGAWDSPEKQRQKESTENTVKTPLEMVENIVSNLEPPPPPPPSLSKEQETIKVKSPKQPKVTLSTIPSFTAPVWTTTGPPLLHSQQALRPPPPLKTVAYPPPPSQPQPQQIQLQPVQPVMQLVNTINGPVLMQTTPVPQIQIHPPQIPPLPTLPLQQQQPQQLPILKKRSKKGGKRTTATTATTTVTATAAAAAANTTLLVSSTTTAQPSIILSQTSLPTPNLVINPNQVILSNGLLMNSAPSQQQIVYNQLPDGTLFQVQPQSTLLTIQQQQQQQPTGATTSLIMATPSSQLVSPPFIPQQMTSSSSSASSSTVSSPSTSPSKSKKRSTPKPLSLPPPPPLPLPPQLSPPPSSPPKLVKEVDEIIDFSADDDDDDEKEEDSKPRISPRGTYIQSNLVDSSGLKATPPHSSSSTNDSTFDALVASVRDRNGGRSSTKSTASRVLFIDSDDDSEYEQEQQHRSLSKQTSPPTKKKKKKRSADELIIQEEIKHNSEEDGEYSLDESGGTHTPGDFKVGDLVWGPLGSFPSWPGKLVRGADDDQKVLVCWFGSKTITEIDPTTLKTLSEGFDAHHKERKKMRKSRKMNASLEKAIQEAMMELDHDDDDG